MRAACPTSTRSIRLMGRLIAYHAFDTARAFNDQGPRSPARSQDTPFVPHCNGFRPCNDAPSWTPDSSALLSLTEDRGRVGLLESADRRQRSSRGRRRWRAVEVRAVGRRKRARLRPRYSFIPAGALRESRGDGTSERSIESLNARLLARHALGPVEEITIAGWNGEPVQMYVTFPRGFDGRRKWPLMHSIYGGPHASHHDGWHFRWNTQVFGAQGYVVAAVNYHGSSGFGQQFLGTITERYGEKDLADIEAASEYLLRRGYVDGERIIATGGSYGGFMVAYMNGHTDRYRAYVCHGGCYDWVSMMATDGYRFFAKELGAFHWDDEARVMQQSPHHYVKEAKTPTLVVHGELDYRVPATQGLSISTR